MDEQQINAASQSFNFTGVEAAKGMTQPGTIAEFTITDVEYIKSEKKGTPGLKCIFEEEAGSVFNHTFYLTANALTRVQTLAKYALNQALSGEATGANLQAMFKGKKLPLKVIARITDNGKVYPDLPFGGFSDHDIKNLKFSAKELADIEAGKTVTSNASIVNADSEDDGIVTTVSDTTPGNSADADVF